MKLLDDPKKPTARRNPRRPHHSHKPLDVVAKMGLKPGWPYCTRRRHHHLNSAPTNLDPKNEERSPQNMRRIPPTDEGSDPPHLHGPKATETRRFAVAPAGGNWDQIALGVPWSRYECNVYIASLYFILTKYVTRYYWYKRVWWPITPHGWPITSFIIGSSIK
jgi:hypothetical protein